MKKTASIAKGKRASAAPASDYVKPQPAKSKPSMALAVAALLINALLLPGLGTILGGRLKHGLIQLLVLLVGGSLLAVLGFFLIMASPILGAVIAILGCLMVFASWVWAIISGAILIKEASA